MDTSYGLSGEGSVGSTTMETDEVTNWNPPRHSLMDVLMPANPPAPKSPRVIRLFTGEDRVSPFA